ncbi:MAG TPA: DUF4124 domain-containing protein [Steroidobacteraceae bacterium]|nr:DUF4124 domain-containing protein [Steroidobacteraceae bacterium]
MTSRTARTRLHSLLVYAALACMAVSAGAWAEPKAPNKAVAYRWVDEQGVIHYGDHIPPQYAKRDRALLNAQGVEVGHLEGQRTPQQLAEEARQRSAQIRQRQHDAFLITTYTSVKDIEALRDSRLDQLKGQRVAAEQYVDTLRSRLAGLQSRALTFKPYNTRPEAHRMPDDLAENLVRTVNDLNVQTHTLAAKNEEETELRAQFQADIERYRELHTIHQQ